jgi:hypothetical protein
LPDDALKIVMRGAERKIGRRLGEVSAALMDDNHLAVDDGLARDGVRACDLGEVLGPIQTIARVDLLPALLAELPY